MTRKECLEAAYEIVTGEREKQYGCPEDCFGMIAALWSIALSDKLKTTPLTARDVAEMMILLKVARSRSGTTHDDNYVDIAGYAACAAELAEVEK